MLRWEASQNESSYLGPQNQRILQTLKPGTAWPTCTYPGSCVSSSTGDAGELGLAEPQPHAPTQVQEPPLENIVRELQDFFLEEIVNWVCHRFPVLPALTNLDISGNRLTGGLEVIYKSSRCPDFAQKFSPNWTSRPLFHTVHCNTSWLLYLERHSFCNWFRNPGKFVKTKLL